MISDQAEQCDLHAKHVLASKTKGEGPMVFQKFQNATVGAALLGL